MKRTKKVLSVFLALLMIISIIPMASITASAASNIVINGVDIGYATGSYFTKNGKSCANSYWDNGKCHNHGICVDSTNAQCNCMRYWPTGKKSTCQVDLLSSQCMGFARYCQWKVYGHHDGSAKSKFTNVCAISSSECTADTLKSKLLGCAPATHIRTGNDGHSQSIISTTSSNVTVAECNVDGYCGVRTKTYTWSEYASYFKSRGGVKYAYSFSSSTGGTTSCSCSTSYAGNYVCTTTSSNLYIRSGHGSSYSAIGSIPKGATVYVSKANGSWAHVTYNGVTGYASMEYLKKVQSKTIHVSNSSVSLTLGGTESKTIYVWTEGSHDNPCSVRWETNSVNISCSWGEWNSEDKLPLTINAYSTGSATITLSVLDKTTNAVLHSITVNVTIDAKSYTVSYNANGGTGVPSSQTKTHGTTLTLSSTKPTRTGYTFLGWSTSSTATTATYFAGGSFTTNANTTLYAVWKANTYSVKYNANGGSGTMSNSSHTYDVAKSLTSNVFTREGYTFLGWSTSSSATSATYTNGQSVKNLTATNGGTVNLYAVWKSDSTALTANSSYSANISYGGKMEYYTFTPSTSGKYVIYSTGSGDTKAYLYNSSGTELTYDDDSGEGNNFRLECDLTAGTTYRFGVKYYNSTIRGTINFTFGQVYNVSYNANGGVGAPTSQKKDYGATLTLSSTVPTRSGYTFLGWSTSSTATSATYQPGGSFTTNANTTLYAIWQKNSTTPSNPDVDFNVRIQEPSCTTIRYNDGIILHAVIEGELPEGATIEWAVDNNNFEGGYSEDGMDCVIVSKNNGYTIVMVIVCDADDNVIAADAIEMRSKAGFFDKIGGFFRSLFGTTKIYEN